ncbi:F-box protein At2g27310-like isoform X1 [Vigna unguiculata]|uniref:F-box protein At2g27310-like isoform X1 n=1 Tax=Vigna unguiculata TaxID=3917 RepID=UPI00101690B1|nr:F-box protein At2g27310-like isoform X1 [Vigna unguiculata]
MPDTTSPPSETTQNTSIFAALHPDIIHAHILTRLDAATLASAASVSSLMHRLCTQEDLWRQICTATWPSLRDPIARRVISTIPGGHRSIYSDAFPSLHHFSLHPRRTPPPPPEELISAVDIYFQGRPVFSRVKRIETQKDWFLSSPLWVDALEPNEMIPTTVKFTRKEEKWLKQVEESLSVSWIVVDPTGKRATNVSSRRAVLARRHWLTREVEVLYAAEMVRERVQCVVKVTCGGKVGGEVHVREVNLVMEDTEGRQLSGKEGVEILQRGMESGVRKKVDAVREKERFEKFTCLMKERRERKFRREKARDLLSTLFALLLSLFFCFLLGF